MFQTWRIKWNVWKKGELNPNYGKKRSEETKKKISIGVKKSRVEKGNPFKGHKHTEEYKNKIGKTVECKELKELGYEYHFTRIGLAEEYVKSTFNINVKRITEVCNGVKPEYVENDGYYIYPTKKHPLFKQYVAFVDKEKGLYCIRAITDEIQTNNYGTEIKKCFFRNRRKNFKNIWSLKTYR